MSLQMNTINEADSFESPDELIIQSKNFRPKRSSKQIAKNISAYKFDNQDLFSPETNTLKSLFEFQPHFIILKIYFCYNFSNFESQKSRKFV